MTYQEASRPLHSLQSPDIVEAYSLPVDKENIIGVETVDTLWAAYDDLSKGVDENTKAAQRGATGYLQKWTIPTVYVNGHAVTTKTEFSEFYNSGQAAFVEDYFRTTWRVYRELLAESVRSGDFSYLIATVVNFKESDLANDLLARMFERKEPQPDIIIGPSILMRHEIASKNNQIKEYKQAVRAYAKTEALRYRRRELQTKLRDDKTGALGALAVGAKFLMSRGGRRRAMRKYFYGPLGSVAALPPVPEQLLRQAQEGLGVRWLMDDLS